MYVELEQRIIRMLLEEEGINENEFGNAKKAARQNHSLEQASTEQKKKRTAYRITF